MYPLSGSTVNLKGGRKFVHNNIYTFHSHLLKNRWDFYYVFHSSGIHLLKEVATP